MKLYGMVHLPPLPGTPGYDGRGMDNIVAYAVNEAEKLVSAGFDGFIVENFMDYPFPIREERESVLQAVRKITKILRERYPDAVIGLNILRNSALEALRIACENKLSFIRVNAYLEPLWAPEGLLEPMAYPLWNEKTSRGCSVEIYADVNVKHAKPILDYIMVLRNIKARGRIDGVIISGVETGAETPASHVYLARRILGDDVEVVIGSGVDKNNIGLYVGLADAVIVGSSIKYGGCAENPIDPRRAVELRRTRDRIEKILGKYRRYTTTSLA